MTIDECLEYIRFELRHFDHPNLDTSGILECVERIDTLSKWVPVSFYLPQKEDANYHGEVLVCLDPMSLENSPCLQTGVELVEWHEVSESKHLFWKSANPPDEYHEYH